MHVPVQVRMNTGTQYTANAGSGSDSKRCMFNNGETELKLHADASRNEAKKQAQGPGVRTGAHSRCREGWHSRQRAGTTEVLLRPESPTTPNAEGGNKAIWI